MCNEFAMPRLGKPASFSGQFPLNAEYRCQLWDLRCDLELSPPNVRVGSKSRHLSLEVEGPLSFFLGHKRPYCFRPKRGQREGVRSAAFVSPFDGRSIGPAN